MNKKVKSLLAVVLILTVNCGFSQRALAFIADPQAFALKGGYSPQNKVAGFTSEYYVDRYSLGLSYEDERWQAKAGMKILPALKVSAGFDFTLETYLVGMDHLWRIGDNLIVTTEAAGFWPQDQNSKGAFYEYNTFLTIGLGEDSKVSPGLRGAYHPGAGHEPEFYLLFDINWYPRSDLQLKFEPLILVEGGFNHQTTLTKQFSSGWRTGVFCGKEQEQWEFGAFMSY